ncbi:MAG: YHS domain-containing (seleno)protein [Myxococcota bacterium]
MRTFMIAAAFLSVIGFVSQAQAGEIFAPKDNIAIRGYDTVAYFEDGRPVKGSPEHQVSWKGATWLFASAQHKATFEQNPAKWAPQFGGWCAYAVANGRKAKTEPDAFTIVDGKLYLNYDLKIQSKWRSNQAAFIKKGHANWPSLRER